MFTPKDVAGENGVKLEDNTLTIDTNNLPIYDGELITVSMKMSKFGRQYQDSKFLDIQTR